MRKKMVFLIKIQVIRNIEKNKKILETNLNMSWIFFGQLLNGDRRKLSN